jgi:DNA polymerase-3 subunit delta
MIIFLYGPDNYRSGRKLKSIVGRYQKVHKSGLNLRRLDCQKNDFDELEKEINQTSMFHEKKLLVLNNLFSAKDFKKKFLERVEDFEKSQDVTVVYERDKVSKKDSLFKSLKKHAQAQEFNPLQGARLKKWVRQEAENMGGGIEDDALALLSDFVQEDLWQMGNELSKLSNFKERGESIREEDVELLVKPKIEPDIFKTIDAIASRDKRRALGLLKNHLNKGDEPLYLLAMINYQFRNLLIISDIVSRGRSPYSSSGLHPFVVRKSLALCRKFTIPELKKVYGKIFQVDLDVKTGRIEPETALDLLITKV